MERRAATHHSPSDHPERGIEVAFVKRILTRSSQSVNASSSRSAPEAPPQVQVMSRRSRKNADNPASSNNDDTLARAIRTIGGANEEDSSSLTDVPSDTRFTNASSKSGANNTRISKQRKKQRLRKMPKRKRSVPNSSTGAIQATGSYAQVLEFYCGIGVDTFMEIFSALYTARPSNWNYNEPLPQNESLIDDMSTRLQLALKLTHFTLQFGVQLLVEHISSHTSLFCKILRAFNIPITTGAELSSAEVAILQDQLTKSILVNPIEPPSNYLTLFFQRISPVVDSNEISLKLSSFLTGSVHELDLGWDDMRTVLEIKLFEKSFQKLLQLYIPDADGTLMRWCRLERNVTDSFLLPLDTRGLVQFLLFNELSEKSILIVDETRSPTPFIPRTRPPLSIEFVDQSKTSQQYRWEDYYCFYQQFELETFLRSHNISIDPNWTVPEYAQAVATFINSYTAEPLNDVTIPVRAKVKGTSKRHDEGGERDAENSEDNMSSSQSESSSILISDESSSAEEHSDFEDSDFEVPLNLRPANKILDSPSNDNEDVNHEESKIRLRSGRRLSKVSTKKMIVERSLVTKPRRNLSEESFLSKSSLISPDRTSLASAVKQSREVDSPISPKSDLNADPLDTNLEQTSPSTIRDNGLNSSVPEVHPQNTDDSVRSLTSDLTIKPFGTRKRRQALPEELASLLSRALSSDDTIVSLPDDVEFTGRPPFKRRRTTSELLFIHHFPPQSSSLQSPVHQLNHFYQIPPPQLEASAQAPAQQPINSTGPPTVVSPMSLLDNRSNSEFRSNASYAAPTSNRQLRLPGYQYEASPSLNDGESSTRQLAAPRMGHFINASDQYVGIHASHHLPSDSTPNNHKPLLPLSTALSAIPHHPQSIRKPSQSYRISVPRSNVTVTVHEPQLLRGPRLYPMIGMSSHEDVVDSTHQVSAERATLSSPHLLIQPGPLMPDKSQLHNEYESIRSHLSSARNVIPYSTPSYSSSQSINAPTSQLGISHAIEPINQFSNLRNPHFNPEFSNPNPVHQHFNNSQSSISPMLSYSHQQQLTSRSAPHSPVPVQQFNSPSVYHHPSFSSSSPSFSRQVLPTFAATQTVVIRRPGETMFHTIPLPTTIEILCRTAANLFGIEVSSVRSVRTRERILFASAIAPEEEFYVLTSSEEAAFQLRYKFLWVTIRRLGSSESLSLFYQMDSTEANQSITRDILIRTASRLRALFTAEEEPRRMKLNNHMLDLMMSDASNESEEHIRRQIKAYLTAHTRFLPNDVLDDVDQILAAESIQAAPKCIDPLTLPPSPYRVVIQDTILELWRGDITQLKVDAIVNAANGYLEGCFRPFHSCIDNAIHAVAGPRLRYACRQIRQTQGYEEPVGCAKITPGFHLPSNYVLHTVGPRVTARRPEPDSEGLASCYNSCLDLCDQNNLRSVALCCISTGVFGYPQLPAARVAIQTTREWVKSHPNSTLKFILFNVFTAEDMEIYSINLPQLGAL